MARSYAAPLYIYSVVLTGALALGGCGDDTVSSTATESTATTEGSASTTASSSATLTETSATETSAGSISASASSGSTGVVTATDTGSTEGTSTTSAGTTTATTTATTEGTEGTTTEGTTTEGSTTEGSASAGTTTEASTTDGTTGDPLACMPYPLPVDADPAAQEAASTALAALAPGAMMTWSPERGTAKSITGLDAALASCPDGEEAMPFVWELVEANPDLFRIDPSEWGPGTSIPCQIIQDKDRIVTVTRNTLGGQPVLRDTIAFRLRRIDGEVKLRGIVGTYIPQTTPELTELMGGCPDLDTAAAIALLKETPLPYTIFQLCVDQDVGSYTPVPSDTFEFDPEPRWLWAEDQGEERVLLTKYWHGRVIVAPANYSEPLLSSDAACPDEVGFRVTFDAVTGEFNGSMPGISCLVC